ncbi:ParB/RepB/Spo0J family partition protein [Guyparkeria hydrothermalis]|uniref:ParB/RepB/Spo0J family partition protein n=1 Tax=Guyparkeria hydrothermalis TaxID=923 RepID=UPI00201FFC5F|nr:ParB/RepB/Spo0J family partition protein [Guyparkeria hydrothermalis]MCL7744921.1 ParB/RepB/Spo0J family partition protein [Guyparkeria hydrothermalis]
MSTKRKGLGRGLDALLGTADRPEQEEDAQLRELAVDLISPNPFQPRKRFDESALTELADSIRAQGVIQPVVVRRRSGEYELIAGERRWRAAQKAGLDHIPAVIREIDDNQAAAMALIENLQREDLDAIEQAQAMQRLVKDFELTHQQVADVLGVSRPAVSNALRLLDLAAPVQKLLRERRIEAGHARSLAALPKKEQAGIADKVVARTLTVRQVESMVTRYLKHAGGAEPAGGDPDTRALERRLGEALGAPVTIQANRRGKGRVTVSFDSLDQLDGLIDRLAGPADSGRPAVD